MDILVNRKKTHGDFTDHARITQTLKETMFSEALKRKDRNQPPINHVQFEALDMIAHKIGRILAGNPDEPDHWLDIAGYATLVHQRLTTANVAPAGTSPVARIQPRSTINSDQPKGIS